MNSNWLIEKTPLPPVMMPLGPEDVPPGSVIRDNQADPSYWIAIIKSVTEGVWHDETGGGVRFTYWISLRAAWQINRSLSLGKWDPNAWEKCEKPQP